MTLDTDTLDALGYGDAWEQLAIRWPLYVCARRAEKAACERARRAVTPAKPRVLTDEQKSAARAREALTGAERARRYRAKRRAA